MECLRTMLLLLTNGVLACGAAHAQPAPDQPLRLAAEAPRGPALKDEISRQFGIFQSRGEDVPQGYVIDRSLISYTFTLRAGFGKTLAGLTPGERWLDIGAGQGQAVLDYYGERYDSMNKEGRERRGRKAQAVAISIEDRRTPAWQETATRLEQGQIRYLAGKRLSQYSPEELGRFQLITDVLGGFSYTENLSRFTQHVLNLLELNGKFYTVLQDVHYENGLNRPYYPDSRFLTEIVSDRGADMKICSWLKSITCVEVACEQKPQWTPPVEVYRVRKICNQVSVPQLTVTHYEAGTPPERRFRLTGAPAAPEAQAGTTR